MHWALFTEIDMLILFIWCENEAKTLNKKNNNNRKKYTDVQKFGMIFYISKNKYLLLTNDAFINLH